MMNREQILSSVRENLTELDPATRELVMTAVEGVSNVYEIQLAGKDAVIRVIQEDRDYYRSKDHA